MAEKGPKKGGQVEKRRPGRKKEARKKNGRKRAEKIFALYAPFPYYYTIMFLFPK